MFCGTEAGLFPSGRLDVCVKGCQDLLECIPGRRHVPGLGATPRSLSDSRSVRLRTRSGAKMSKAEDLSCKSASLVSANLHTSFALANRSSLSTESGRTCGPLLKVCTYTSAEDPLVLKAEGDPLHGTMDEPPPEAFQNHCCSASGSLVLLKGREG